MNLILLFLATAAAQDASTDGVDGHHFKPVPTYGDPLDRVETWRIDAESKRSFGVSGLFDASSGGLVSVYEDWNGTTETALLDDIYALNLGLRASVARRLAVTASAPLYLASTGVDGPQGFGVGDLRIAAPIGLLLPDGRGLSLGLVPLLDLPTGNSAELLGNSGLGAGGLAAVGWHAPRLSADLNLGFERLPSITFENLRGGDRLLASLGAGVAVTESIGLGAEINLDRGLQATDVGTDSPTELLLSARGHHGAGLSWTAGGGAGLSEGPGAPAWRAFAGVGWAYIDNPDADPDKDGILGRLDACPRAPEVQNGYRDVDGCPDALADLSLTVVDDEGQPLPGATVTMNGQPQTLTSEATLSLTGQTPGENTTLLARAPGRVDAGYDGALDEGANSRTLTLAWLPGTTRVRVHDEAGKPLTATLSFKGPATLPAQTLGETGQTQLVLPAGEWQILATAEGFGTEGRVVQVDGQKPGRNTIDFTLTPPRAQVVRKEVVISESVLFDFNEATLRPDSDPLLRQVAGQLLAHPELKRIEIQGHSDDVGDDAYNLDLSQRRVDAVLSWLVANGVAADRLVAKGYGETRPIATNGTEQGRATNRRVQFMILEKEE